MPRIECDENGRMIQRRGRCRCVRTGVDCRTAIAPESRGGLAYAPKHLRNGAPDESRAASVVRSGVVDVHVRARRPADARSDRRRFRRPSDRARSRRSCGGWTHGALRRRNARARRSRDRRGAVARRDRRQGGGAVQVRDLAGRRAARAWRHAALRRGRGTARDPHAGPHVGQHAATCGATTC